MLRQISKSIELGEKTGGIMLGAALGFFLLALLAVLFGANGIAGMSMEIGRTLLFIFLILAFLSFLASLFRGGRGKPF